MKSILLITVLICMAIWGFFNSANSQELNYVNSVLWSYFNDIKVVDTLAYCVSRSGLMIINVANPEQPRLLSRIFTPGESRKVDVAGNYVYFMDNTFSRYELGRGFVYCYEISDPVNPQFCSVWGGEYNWMPWVNDLDVADTLAYVVWYKIAVVNYADPYQPEMICDGDAYGFANAVFYHENFLYSFSDYEFNIFDVSQPDNPILTATEPVGDYITLVDLFVDDGYCYILADKLMPWHDWLWIYDISDPYNIEIVTEAQIAQTFNGDIKVVGDYAYISTEPGLRIYDISNPRFPEEVSNTLIFGSLALEIFNDRAYLASRDYGMLIYNIANPELPLPLGTFTGGYSTQDVFVTDSLAYVATHYDDLQILDISNLNEIGIIGSFNDTLRGAFEIEVNGDFAYAGFSFNTLYVFDISNPSNPEVTYANPNFSEATDMVFGDHFLFISSMDDGISIFDISNPGSPVLVGHLLENTRVQSLCLRDTVLFAANYMDGVYAFDVSSPSRPDLIIIFSDENPHINFASVTVDDNLLYVGRYYDGLKIIDVSDIEEPMVIRENVSIFTGFAEIIDDILIAALADNVSLYDIANPANPVLLNWIHSPENINDMIINGHLIYLCTNASLVIYELTTTGISQVAEIPTSFALSPNYPNPFNAQTTIHYSLPKASSITLDIYDILGRKVQTLYKGSQVAGEHSLTWNADEFASGVYFYRLTTGKFEQTEKMMLIK